MFVNPKLLKKCLFIDIETVSEMPSYEMLPDIKKSLWAHKAKSLFRGVDSEISEEDRATLYNEKAGIYAEFAKVVCISMGFLHFENEVPTKIRIKSISNHDEKIILEEFATLLSTHYNDVETCRLSGHNIKEFDVPFLCRRMVFNQVKFPAILDISGKKPWETFQMLDTLEMWKFGDYKNYTSLNLLSGTLGVPSPKDDIDGSMVGNVYWQEQDLDRIVIYCQKDVITVIQVMMRFAGLPLFEEGDIDYIGTNS